MIGLDTNLLPRAVLNDDAVQSPKAREIISALTPEKPGYVGLAAVLEFSWALRTCYRQPQQAIYQLWINPAIVISNRDFGRSVINNAAIDFADALLAAENWHVGCTATLTFDREALADPHFQAAGA